MEAGLSPWGWVPCRDRALLPEVLNGDSHPQEGCKNRKKAVSLLEKYFRGDTGDFGGDTSSKKTTVSALSLPVLVYDLQISETWWQGLFLEGLVGLRLMETFVLSSACWVSAVAGLGRAQRGELSRRGAG